MHFFTAFPDAWLSGTADLSAEETGCFWNLCCFYMLKDGAVADDDQMLARVCKVSTRRWRIVRKRLIEGCFIEVREGFVWQAKCEERLEKDGKFSTSQRDKVAKRWANRRANSLNNNKSANTPVDTAAYTSTASASTSVARATGAIAPGGLLTSAAPINPAGVIFDQCRTYLESCGVKEQDARSLLGKWRSKVGEGQLIEIVADAQRRSISEPVGWIMKAVAARTSTGRVGAI
jgi:uncharacterized protein YdaU (DUF1376 family)